MKTKYKILLFMILLIAVISVIPNKIFAVVGEDDNGKYFSPPQPENVPSGSPHSPFFPYVLSSGTENGRTRMYFCAEKQGALKYYQLPSYYSVETDSDDESGTTPTQTDTGALDNQTVYVLKDGMEVSPLNFGYDMAFNSDKYTEIKENLANLVMSETNKYYLRYRKGTNYDGMDATDEPSTVTGGEDSSKFFRKIKDGEDSVHQFNKTPFIRTVTYYGKLVGETPKYYYEKEVANHSETNGRISYIISSGIDKQSTTNAAGITNNYQETLSDQYAGDIMQMQYAVWQDHSGLHPHSGGWYHNIGEIPTSDNDGVSDIGTALYKEAEDYVKFHDDNIKNGYEAKFNSVTSTKIFVDGTTKKYTVGPYTLTYPDDPRFSYIDDMVLVNYDTGAETRDFKIIKADTERTYPGDGEEFYVEFEASKLNYPEKIDIKVTFKYLNETFSNYKRIDGRGRLFRWEAWVNVELTDYYYYVSGTVLSELNGANGGNGKDVSAISDLNKDYIGSATDSEQEYKSYGRQVYDYDDSYTEDSPSVKYEYNVSGAKTEAFTHLDKIRKVLESYEDTIPTYYYKVYSYYNTTSWSYVSEDTYNDPDSWYNKQYDSGYYDYKQMRDKYWNVTSDEDEAEYFMFGYDYYTYNTGYTDTWDETSSHSSYSVGTYGYDGYQYYEYHSSSRTVTKYRYKLYKTTYRVNRWQCSYEWKAGLKYDKLGNPYYEVQAYTVYDVETGNIARRLTTHNVTEDTGADRSWKEKVVKGGSTDLRTKIAGNVWEEIRENAKDTSLYDGSKTSGRDMQNMKVYLFKKGQTGTALKSALTDSTGHYEFVDLPAIDANGLVKYSVVFEYNGQYYEASKYNAPADTAANFNLSNGTEYQVTTTAFGNSFLGRTNLNERFSKIGATKDNYGPNMQTYRREELEAAGAIDENGNLKSGANSAHTTFVRSSMIFSLTKNTSNVIDVYPLSNKYCIYKDYSATRGTTKVYNIGTSSYGTYSQITTIRLVTEDKSQHINQALKKRIQTDMSLASDVNKVVLEINGKTKQYDYGALAQYKCSGGHTGNHGIQFIFDPNITVDGVKGAYKCKTCGSTTITRQIATVSVNMADYEARVYPEDYMFKAGTNSGYSSADELNVFVTYKIEIANEAATKVKLDELVTYYDNDYSEYVVDRSYVTKGQANGVETTLTGVGFSNTSKYDASRTVKTISGYKNMYVTTGDNAYLEPGELIYIYITFKVGKDSNGRIKLDENVNTGADTGAKELITEINGYSIKYANGTTIVNVGNVANTWAGIIDRDSKPGNFNGTDNLNEDDTYKAPKLKIKLIRDGNRKITGYVWDDVRNKTVGNAQIGDGIRQSNESNISNVKVELIEVKNNSEYVRSTFTTKDNANTNLVITGNNNILKSEAIQGNYGFAAFIPGDYYLKFTYGDNNTTYNGQDYKSTLYQVGFGDTYSTGNPHSTLEYNKEQADGVNINYSDAQDIWSRRTTVNNYSSQMNYNLAKELNDKNSASYKTNTYMIAETGLMKLGIEYSNDPNANGTQKQAAYHLKNVDFGLTGRPKAQIEIGKKVSHLNVTLANGTILYDATGTTPNLGWSNNNLSTNIYNGKLIRSNSDIINSRYIGGIVAPIIDKELMHGAVITVTYEFEVRNIGELDYSDAIFYYKGKNGATVVTTTPLEIVDYVPNNLKYEAANNTGLGWTVVDTATLKTKINSSLESSINTFNTKLIKTNSTALTPMIYGGNGYTTTFKLVLNQTLSQKGNDDFINKVEVIKVANSAGRRMEYSLVGNFNPTGEPQELDEAKMRVAVNPPTGSTLVYVIISVIVVVAAAIIITGGVFIKKKVLNK